MKIIILCLLSVIAISFIVGAIAAYIYSNSGIAGFRLSDYGCNRVRQIKSAAATVGMIAIFIIMPLGAISMDEQDRNACHDKVEHFIEQVNQIPSPQVKAEAVSLFRNRERCSDELLENIHRIK